MRAIVPMEEWMTIEAAIEGHQSRIRKEVPRPDNYYGQLAEVDAQGRLLVHPMLRSALN
jgi:hypothetical protein